MCGPSRDDEKRKATRERFLNKFSSACAETICERSSIFAPAPLFDGRKREISVPPRPKNGRGKKNQERLV